MIAFALVMGMSAQAQEKKNKNAKFSFEVNGNCEQCKKRIEKAAYGVPGVKSATWDESSHLLTGIINEEKTSIPQLKKSVAKAGHDSDTEKATADAYDKLPACCKYEKK